MNIRVPVSWLRDYLKANIAAKTIANLLSLSGPSIERVEKRGDDYIFDVEVTSNRSDAFSVFGIAREANAILTNENIKSELISPKGLNLPLEPDRTNPLTLDVKITDHRLCPRFTAIIVDNVKIKPSPAIICKRLESVGIRAINNIVDISNYIMLELGQPMHTFDFDKIKNHKMTLRPSREGEKIKTLDGKVQKLPAGAIVIEDEGRLIDLCGIMGGENSQITRRTKKVVLFVQAYDPQTIRKTCQALAFRTEAATRFEKGIDLEGIVPALSRAVYLTKQVSNAKIASELIDITAVKSVEKTISLSLNKLKNYLGVEISVEKTTKILGLLGFAVKTTPQVISAVVPSWRILDVKDDVDLIEEIARVYGYHHLPSNLPEGQIPQGGESDLAGVIELKKALKYLSLTEVISYSIIAKELFELSKTKEKEAVELANPLTSEWQFMRPTVLVSLAQVIAENQNIEKDIKVFEVAKTYIKNEGDLPKQDLMLAIAWQNADFYQIKGLVENVFEILLRIPKFQKFTGENHLFEKEEVAQIKVGESLVGTCGILNDQIIDYFNLEGQVAACEINLSTIYQLPTFQLSYKPVPKYSAVIEDISAIFNQKTLLAEIIAQVKKAGSPLVKKVDVIDIFKDEKIGKDKKSVTLRLTYQRSDRTPTQEEVIIVREKIIDAFSKSFQAIIRR